MANQRLIIFCDNQATVSILRRLKAEDFITRTLVRHFALCCMHYNIICRIEHIPGAANKGPDALSRGQFHKFGQMFPHMQHVQKNIPAFLSPYSCLMSD